MKKIICGESSLSEAKGILSKTFKKTKYFTMVLKIGKQRTIPQNSGLYKWYLKISRELEEYSPEEIRCQCKLHVGLPILRGDNSEINFHNDVININELCEAVLDPLPYEDQLKVIYFIPISSEMTTKQMNEYREGIRRNYAGRVELLYQDEE